MAVTPKPPQRPKDLVSYRKDIVLCLYVFNYILLERERCMFEDVITRHSAPSILQFCTGKLAAWNWTNLATSGWGVSEGRIY